jgi:hypothetical protein
LVDNPQVEFGDTNHVKAHVFSEPAGKFFDVTGLRFDCFIHNRTSK